MSPEEKKNKENKHNILSEIFSQHTMHRPLESRFFVITMFVSVVFGLFAGFVGGLVVPGYIQKTELQYSNRNISTNDNKNDVLISVKPVSSEDFNEIEKRIYQTYLGVKNAVVHIYAKKYEGDTLFTSMYLENNKRGNGVVLTSDGWLLTTTKAIGTMKLDEILVESNGTLYPVDGIIADTASQVVFVKISARNLSVVSLGSHDTLRPGQMAVTLDGRRRLVTTYLESLDAHVVREPKDSVISSEELVSLLSITSSLQPSFEGSPLFSLDGEVIGVLSSVKNTDRVSEVLPLTQFKSLIADVLKTGVVHRPYLGVHYVDLSEIALSATSRKALDIDTELVSGALLFSFQQEEAVVKNSPAQKTDLHAGDIITGVNDEALTDLKDLSMLINEYQPGDRVNLRLIRENKELFILVELSEIPKIVPEEPNTPQIKSGEKKKK